MISSHVEMNQCNDIRRQPSIALFSMSWISDFSAIFIKA